MTAAMPEPRLRDDAIRKQRPLHLRLAETPPPAAVDRLDAWVRRTNHQLLLDQGYSPKHAARVSPLTTTDRQETA